MACKLFEGGGAIDMIRQTIARGEGSALHITLMAPDNKNAISTTNKRKK